MKKKKVKDRKIMVSIFLTKEDIDFLDGKIDYSDSDRKSRSAVIRNLILIAMRKNLI
jgi:hypothetical protein